MRAYEVGALLGRGGMGAVFRARRRADGRPIALKIMSSQANPERFRREAEALARIAHPNVVRVLDFGEEAGGLFLAMEFVEGESLEERIRRQGALPVEDALGWTRALAGALRHVHARGVVHRDIKPENVMIREDGSACLVDFGLALTLDDDRLTKTGQVLGTLAYAAPELLLGRPEAVGPPADVFSLGATLYALLTGSAPIPDGLFGAMLIQAQDVMPPAPRTFCSGVPPDLDRVCMACLAKDPAQRPTLTALIESLDACARSEGRTSWVLVAAGLLVLGLILAGTALVDSERLDPSQELAPALGSQVVERLTVSASGSGAPSAPASPLEESRRDWPRPNDPLAFPDA
ncbi:MAG: serine/threonine protein kinase, partial [Planctomycetes bacterium]|nr:serine/threonine protein kinase [Planctomycetota bacterium]